MEHTEISEYNHDMNDANMSETEDDLGGNREDEAQEVPNPPTGEAIKPKRIIKNPQPKLDANRLMGPRGITILPSTFKETKFKGKGYEREDLNLLMKKLEHWAHRLFPKLTFDDTLKQIEKLGTKKPVQNLVRRIRLDIYQSDEMSGTTEIDGTENSKVDEEVDVFDELLGTERFATNTNMTLTSNTSMRGFNDLLMSPTPSVINTSHKQTTLTEEQKERIERNKRLAAERRKAKLLEQQNLESHKVIVPEVGCSDSSVDIPQNDSSSILLPNSVCQSQGSSLIVNSDSCENPKIVEEIDSTLQSSSFEESSLVKNYLTPQSEPFVTSHCSKIIFNEINEAISSNKSEMLNLNNQQVRHQSNSDDISGTDLVDFIKPKSVKQSICTEDDILALMGNDA